MIGVDSIREYFDGYCSECVVRKSQQYFDSVIWYWDGFRLYVRVPSSSNVGKFYDIVVDKHGNIEKPCDCPAYKQGRKFWHLNLTAKIWFWARDFGSKKCGRGNEILKEGDEAEDYFKELCELKKSKKEVREVKVDLIELSPTLQVLEGFIKGLVE